MSLALCNQRQRAFIDAYIRNGGNGSSAYVEAYNTTDSDVAKKGAYRLLTYDYIKAAVEERQADLNAMADVSMGNRFKWLQQAIQGALEHIPVGESGTKMNSPSAVASLVSELNKMTGGHAPTKVAETDADGNDKPTGIEIKVVGVKSNDESGDGNE